jgi:hypothetical protein
MAAFEDVGFCITKVIAGRQAEALGMLHVGDIITHVNGSSIAGNDIRDVIGLIGAGARFAPVAIWGVSLTYTSPNLLSSLWRAFIDAGARLN